MDVDLHFIFQDLKSLAHSRDHNPTYFINSNGEDVLSYILSPSYSPYTKNRDIVNISVHHKDGNFWFTSNKSLNEKDLVKFTKKEEIVDRMTNLNVYFQPDKYKEETYFTPHWAISCITNLMERLESEIPKDILTFQRSRQFIFVTSYRTGNMWCQIFVKKNNETDIITYNISGFHSNNSIDIVTENILTIEDLIKTLKELYNIYINLYNKIIDIFNLIIKETEKTHIKWNNFVSTYSCDWGIPNIIGSLEFPRRFSIKYYNNKFMLDYFESNESPKNCKNKIIENVPDLITTIKTFI